MSAVLKATVSCRKKLWWQAQNNRKRWPMPRGGASSLSSYRRTVSWYNSRHTPAQALYNALCSGASAVSTSWKRTPAKDSMRDTYWPLALSSIATSSMAPSPPRCSSPRKAPKVPNDVPAPHSPSRLM